jgi:hypothetical protein
MEVFLHSANSHSPRVVEVDEKLTVRETLIAYGSEHDGLWIEDVNLELDAEVTLEVAGVSHHSHLHHHRCRQVDIAVHYIDEARNKDFGPATTVKEVLKWALGPHGYNVPAPEHPEFGFLGCDDGKAVPENIHVGSLTGPSQYCETCLNLVKKHNPQG